MAMKKNIKLTTIIFLLLTVLITSAVSIPLTGCTEKEKNQKAEDKGIMEIDTDMFIKKVNELYFNTDEYLGITVSYEGIFKEALEDSEGVTHAAVIRYGPGCCGIDADSGFEVVYDGKMPKDDDWVKVTGILEQYGSDDHKHLQVNCKSIEVLDERGQEQVSH